jgi:hypothetical protein
MLTLSFVAACTPQDSPHKDSQPWRQSKSYLLAVTRKRWSLSTDATTLDWLSWFISPHTPHLSPLIPYSSLNRATCAALYLSLSLSLTNSSALLLFFSSLLDDSLTDHLSSLHQAAEAERFCGFIPDTELRTKMLSLFVSNAMVRISIQRP